MGRGVGHGPRLPWSCVRHARQESRRYSCSQPFGGRSGTGLGGAHNCGEAGPIHSDAGAGNLQRRPRLPSRYAGKRCPPTCRPRAPITHFIGRKGPQSRWPFAGVGGQGRCATAGSLRRIDFGLTAISTAISGARKLHWLLAERRPAHLPTPETLEVQQRKGAALCPACTAAATAGSSAW